jgi:hypothetical protein
MLVDYEVLLTKETAVLVHAVTIGLFHDRDEREGRSDLVCGRSDLCVRHVCVRIDLVYVVSLVALFAVFLDHLHGIFGNRVIERVNDRLVIHLSE